MVDTLAHLSQTSHASGILDIISPILAALLGGGIVSLIFDIIRGSRRAKKIRRLFESEIRMNMQVMQSDAIKNFPWMTHKSWSAFYDANSIEIISFGSEKVRDKVIMFYNLLETLKQRDTEFEKEIDRLNAEQKYDAVEAMRGNAGFTKQELRKDMIKIASEILKPGQRHVTFWRHKEKTCVPSQSKPTNA